MKNSSLTAKKAMQILKDGTIRGKAITDKQRKFFGSIASMKEGGDIKIKKSHEGLFTKAAQSHGMSVSEFEKYVLNNKDKFSPARIRQANFSRNVRGWKKEDGGFIKYNAPSHDDGGMLVNKLGHPDTTDAVAEVEKNEVVLRNSAFGPQYVLSDDMINPQTGNTIAKDASRMENKMKGDDAISTAGRMLSRKMFKRINEMQKRKMQPGGLLGDPVVGPEEEIDYQKRLEQFRQLRDNPGAVLPENDPRITNPIEITDMTMGDSADMTGRTFDDVLPNVAGLSDLMGGIGAGMKIGAGLLSAADAIAPSEKEKLQVPDFSAGDRYFADLGIDPQALKNQVIAAANATKAAAREGSGSFGQYLNRLRATDVETGRQTATQELAAKQYNDQVKMQQGIREDRKATITSAEKVRQQMAQSQNDARRADKIQNILNQVDAFGTEFMANDVLNKEMQNLNDADKKQFLIDIAAMESRYPDFNLSDELKNLLTDPNASWEQIRDALSKDLVSWKGGGLNIAE